MKRASNKPVLKLLACEVLEAISKRNFQMFKQKKYLRATVEELIQTIFNSSMAVVIQIAIEIFNKIAQSNNSSVFGKEMMDFFISQNYSRYFQAKFSFEYDIRCLELDHKYVLTHECKQSRVEPMLKKMRMASFQSSTMEQPVRKNIKNEDYLINNLKQSSEQLVEKVIKSDLNARQIADIQKVVNNLTCFL